MSEPLIIRTALVSVYDKTGLSEFAKTLANQGVRIISSGGTSKYLAENGISHIKVEDVTGFPECLDGRVKTLHPKIHAGILARRDDSSHMKQLLDLQIEPIDLVCINLYPFWNVAFDESATDERKIELIDIGGPAMIRAAAKNFAGVVVVCHPDGYGRILSEISESGGISFETRGELAAAAFSHTQEYDALVAEYFKNRFVHGYGETQEDLLMLEEGDFRLRYGENPHQEATFCSLYEEPTGFALALQESQGSKKEFSFNNILDADAAYRLAHEFDQPAVAIIKHMNPCGCAVGGTLLEAFQKALACDPVSAYGGIVASNIPIDIRTAEAIAGEGTFFEVVIAPALDEGVEEILRTRRKWGANLRLAVFPYTPPMNDIKSVAGGHLVQRPDLQLLDEGRLQIVTRRAPTDEEMAQLKFGWAVVKHTKSNAIVFAKDFASVGVGMGQVNRVDSVRLAAERAGERAKGAVCASDAFFPFPDGPEIAINAGITAFIQPGGSIRDQETVELCDARGVAMVFTGMRHFKH